MTPTYTARKFAQIPPLREMYRAYLRNLRYVPDPHVWQQVAPRYKALMYELARPVPDEPIASGSGTGDVNESGGTGKGKERAVEVVEKIRREADDLFWKRKRMPPSAEEAAAEAEVQRILALRERRHRDIRRAKSDLLKLRAAVACHPHALTRLLSESYGQSGRIRWQLLKNITESSPIPLADWPSKLQKTARKPTFPPQDRQPLPSAMRPCRHEMGLREMPDRLRPIAPSVMRNIEKKYWRFAWDESPVPIVLPPNPHGTVTGWEGKGIVETLEALAAVSQPAVVPPSPVAPKVPPPVLSGPDPRYPRTLPSFANLAPSLQRIFPQTMRIGSPPDALAKPRPAHTRQTPKLWREPRRLDLRLIRRTYQRFYESLPWIEVAYEEPNSLEVEEAKAAKISRERIVQEERLRAKGKEVSGTKLDLSLLDPNRGPHAFTVDNKAYPNPATRLEWRVRRDEDRPSKLRQRFSVATDEEKKWYAHGSISFTSQTRQERRKDLRSSKSSGISIA